MKATTALAIIAAVFISAAIAAIIVKPRPIPAQQHFITPIGLA